MKMRFDATINSTGYLNSIKQSWCVIQSLAVTLDCRQRGHSRQYWDNIAALAALGTLCDEHGLVVPVKHGYEKLALVNIWPV